ncbi:MULTISPECIES: nucleoside recognition domain-containing protein [Hafnia]|jgi:nucleoside recognition membrane protein YjiH|uniref:Nucleoside transporter/FeoB GTPase Gate domain-containing protein n=2 Tax=Hafnia TaxID=568 RepID=A0A4Q9EN83_9GAMM|nr:MULTISPECIES: nucleoside recognition domain-containing protein [Hafnia]AJQ99974.1 hypothetical protein F652_1985 [Enterobacteriaceae bacterium bta3-1]EHM42139.1 transporter gate domain protein [Hafnia alvei ATCC 51873]OFS07921.1 hypothetical protein HMPREF3091_20580 [Hafnia sp. HMSC23F03]QQE44297.1 hypothetical protein I6H95_03005 [Hafnia alvei]TBM25891.1 hypothetical protein EYY89_11550 [Hafnia paralvei]
MKHQEAELAAPSQKLKVTWVGYFSFFLTIIFFSGMFSGSDGWWRVFDFTVLNGSFGHVNGDSATTAVTFRGVNGAGAKDGFLFALELAPSVILSLGIISVTDGLGGLRAAQQLMTPILRPILGIPGICSLALIANLQNTDAAAGMTKELAEEGEITEQEKVIFAAYQTSGSAIITNYFSSGVAVFAFLGTSVIVPLGVILLFKFVGANILRVYINFAEHRTVNNKE